MITPEQASEIRRLAFDWMMRARCHQNTDEVHRFVNAKAATDAELSLLAYLSTLTEKP